MTVLSVLVVVALAFAGFPAVMYFRNARLFRKPARLPDQSPAVSVLIPARNEENSIGYCLLALLDSQDVTFEVIVLDDGSTDHTAEIVTQLAAKDARVRLEPAPPLPDGWSGKQHACYTLAKLARYEIITFLDADVRLQPHALANLAGFLHASKAGLVSGFPRQETVTLLEKLIIPLINWLLLGYLPFDQMRTNKQPGLGAGCGQWFMTTKAAYEAVGGHGHPLVKGSFHDGIKLPRAYRTAGYLTDICDATDDATCRMYRSAGQVWNGFAKNAHEGLGGPVLIWVWTVMLFAGHVLPFVLVGFAYWMPLWEMLATFFACCLSLIPRLFGELRFRQTGVSLLHPVGVLALLGIQWYAQVRRWLGRPVGWKGRTVTPPATPASAA